MPMYPCPIVMAVMTFSLTSSSERYLGKSNCLKHVWAAGCEEGGGRKEIRRRS